MSRYVIPEVDLAGPDKKAQLGPAGTSRRIGSRNFGLAQVQEH